VPIATLPPCAHEHRRIAQSINVGYFIWWRYNLPASRSACLASLCVDRLGTFSPHVQPGAGLRRAPSEDETVGREFIRAGSRPATKRIVPRLPFGKNCPAEHKRTSYGGHGGHGVIDKCYNAQLQTRVKGLINGEKFLRGSLASLLPCWRPRWRMRGGHGSKMKNGAILLRFGEAQLKTGIRRLING
jgi:hypothetical protein